MQVLHLLLANGGEKAVGIVTRVAALAFLPACLHASANTGAAFLKIDTGARPAALGGAYTAIADDVNALSYNPGGLAQLKKREIGATHTQWLLDSTFDFLGYAQPTSLGTFGLGITRLTSGNTDSRDANRQTSGGYTAADTAYTLGFSHTIQDGTRFLDIGRTSVGMNVKYLQSQIGPYSASGVAFDFGATHQVHGSPLSLGFAALNLGKGLKFIDQTDPLPLSFSLGVGYRLAGALQLTLDARQEVYDKRTDVSMGTEYGLFSGFLLRAGYGSQLAHASVGATQSPLSGLSGGFGLRFLNYRADYTFAPFGVLGNVQRISLGARF